MPFRFAGSDEDGGVERDPRDAERRHYTVTMLTSLGARMMTFATSRPASARTTDSSARARCRSSSSVIAGRNLQPTADLALNLYHAGHRLGDQQGRVDLRPAGIGHRGRMSQPLPHLLGHVRRDQAQGHRHHLDRFADGRVGWPDRPVHRLARRVDQLHDPGHGNVEPVASRRTARSRPAAGGSRSAVPGRRRPGRCPDRWSRHRPAGTPAAGTATSRPVRRRPSRCPPRADRRTPRSAGSRPPRRRRSARPGRRRCPGSCSSPCPG